MAIIQTHALPSGALHQAPPLPAKTGHGMAEDLIRGLHVLEFTAFRLLSSPFAFGMQAEWHYPAIFGGPLRVGSALYKSGQLTVDASKLP